MRLTREQRAFRSLFTRPARPAAPATVAGAARPSRRTMLLASPRLPRPCKVVLEQKHGVWFFVATEAPLSLSDLIPWGDTDSAVRRFARHHGYSISDPSQVIPSEGTHNTRLHREPPAQHATNAPTLSEAQRLLALATVPDPQSRPPQHRSADKAEAPQDLDRVSRVCLAR